MNRPGAPEGPLPFRAHALGVGLAIVAALHKVLYASVLVNDDFMHRAYGLQLLGGDRPVRDFFDYGMVLMYGLSAAAQMVVGYRLLAEALVIGVAVGASTYLVFVVVRRISGSPLAATIAALLLIVAMPRSYGYPKLFVYAVAAALWWRYIAQPSSSRAIALGVWTAVAFYWRPDHGVIVAVGVALAMIAAHGVSLHTWKSCVQAGAVTLALIAPWLVFASVQSGGFDGYVRTFTIAGTDEHLGRQAMPRWPLRRLSDLVGIDPSETYAPSIGLRWTAGSSPQSRQQALDRYGLTVVSTRDAVSQTVRVSAHTLEQLRALIADPIVEDTDGLDRGAAAVSPSVWPASERRRFERWWLRIRVLPGLDPQVEAGEAAALWLFALPLAAIAAGGAFARHLPAGVSPAHVAAFAAFALLVDVGMLRTPFHVRVGDAVVLPAILLGLMSAMFLRAARGQGLRVRWLAHGVAAIGLVLLMKSLAVAGQSGERVTWVAGEWDSLDRSRAAWEEVTGRLTASPPIEYWRNRSPEVTLRLAAYARECLQPSERILVMWFAPEIYYYSDRLMAGRHTFYVPELGTLVHEREMEMMKIRSSLPAIIFTRSLSGIAADKTFPDVAALVAADYRLGAAIEDDDRYLILVRKDRTPVSLYGDGQWPCYR